MPQIEVTFDIDANGILNVSAKDHATNKEQKITITASTGLSKEEAERMRKEAESHADEDKKKLAEIEARNSLDNRVYQIEKLIERKPREAVRIRRQAGGRGRRLKAKSRAGRRKSSTRFSRPRRTRSALRTSSPKCSTRALKRVGRRRARRAASGRRTGRSGAARSRIEAPRPRRSHRRRIRGRGRNEEAELTRIRGVRRRGRLFD